MRKISIKVNANTDIEEVVKLDDFFIADDLSYVSGICSPNISIASNGKCNVSIDSGSTFQTANCETSVVKRMGYITINGVKYYVEDGFVTYGNEQYMATYIKNSTNTAFDNAYVLIDNDKYDIQDCQVNQWKSVRKVKVSNYVEELIFATDCECIGLQDCIIVDGKVYDVFYEGEEKPYVVYNNCACYAIPYEENGVEFYKHSDLTDSWFEFDSPLLGKYSCKSYEKKSDNGFYINLFIDKYKTELLSIKEKDFLEFVYSTETDLMDFEVEYDKEQQPYIDYYGTMYPISADMKVCVVIDNKEFPITLNNTMTNDDTMWVGYITDYPNALVSAQTNSEGVITDVYRRLLVEDGNDKYWANEKVDFISYSGITFGNKNYFVDEKFSPNFEQTQDTDEIVTYDVSCRYISLPNNLHLNCVVESVNVEGAVLKVYPISLNGNKFDTDYNDQFGKILGSIANNIGSFSIIKKSNLFGLHIDYVGDLYDYNKETLKDTLLLKPTAQGLNLQIPFEKETALNLKNEWNIKELLEERIMANINGFSDIDRDIYTPCYADEEGVLHLMKSIKFNLHFRTRNLNDWSVIEDNVELNNDGCSSWNCLDHYYNTSTNDDENDSIVYTNEERERYADKLVSCSDLLYFLNFTDNDVFYQKSALSKSFLRLSFFDSPTPNQQSLLYTSTLFFDEGKCFMKYINNIENTSFTNYTMNGSNRPIGVKNEPIDKMGFPTFDNEQRLCMEFVASNKISSRVCSEGFYLYIYKAYANKLHPRRIYMRVDFNHAKNGKSVPMMLLKHHNEEGATYQAQNIKDVFDMREGVPMKDILSYIYIPIIVRYDENLNRYTYRFEHLVESETEHLEINLFEVKFKDESK